jgi:hypothetical protein
MNRRPIRYVTGNLLSLLVEAPNASQLDCIGVAVEFPMSRQRIEGSLVKFTRNARTEAHR